jgi:hypothetical protein
LHPVLRMDDLIRFQRAFLSVFQRATHKKYLVLRRLLQMKMTE